MSQNKYCFINLLLFFVKLLFTFIGLVFIFIIVIYFLIYCQIVISEDILLFMLPKLSTFIDNSLLINMKNYISSLEKNEFIYFIIYTLISVVITIIGYLIPYSLPISYCLNKIIKYSNMFYEYFSYKIILIYYKQKKFFYKIHQLLKAYRDKPCCLRINWACFVCSIFLICCFCSGVNCFTPFFTEKYSLAKSFA